MELNRDHLVQQGYEVLCAETIQKARVLAAEHPPDLYLLDVMLPDGSGVDFCHELRRYTTAPVIFLTCLEGNDDIIRGIEQGGDDYITKPYDLNILSARIMAQLRRAGFVGHVRVELPPLTVDLVRGQAILEGRTIPLSQKETQLLAYLAAHAGREFTKAELLREIWGNDAGSTTTLKAHISFLRKKLALDDNSPIELLSTPQGRYVLSRTVFEAAR